MVEAKKIHANDTSKGLKHEESYTKPTETKVIPTVTIPFGHGTNHRDPAQRHTSDWTHNGAHRKPSMTMTQGGKVKIAHDTMSLCVILVSYLTATHTCTCIQVDEGPVGEGDSEALAVVRSIMQRQWFPRRLRNCSTEEVCTGLGQ